MNDNIEEIEGCDMKDCVRAKEITELQKDVAVLKSEMGTAKADLNSIKEDVKEIKKSNKEEFKSVREKINTMIISGLASTVLILIGILVNIFTK